MFLFGICFNYFSRCSIRNNLGENGLNLALYLWVQSITAGKVWATWLCYDRSMRQLSHCTLMRQREECWCSASFLFFLFIQSPTKLQVQPLEINHDSIAPFQGSLFCRRLDYLTTLPFMQLQDKAVALVKKCDVEMQPIRSILGRFLTSLTFVHLVHKAKRTIC